MASKIIKGLTVEIGGDTTKLGTALEKVNKQSTGLSKELGQINKLLKLDPGNTELLAQKQKVLSEAVANTSEKLDKLKEAEKQVQEQFKRGEVSEEQVRDLQREIIATTKKMEGYEKAIKETAEEMENLGQKEKKATKSTEEVADAMNLHLGEGLKVVTGLAAAAGAAIAGVVESTQAYRTEMGKLDTAFTSNGHSSEVAKQTYKELQSILGETDQAVEAANHLAQLTDKEEDLASWTDICTGVYAKFGASLPIEGLTEAANETSRTGTLTGGLVDALNWGAEAGETFGVKLKKATKENEEWNKAVEEATSAEEFFQLALDECSNEQERQALITKTLTDLYSKAGKQYKTTNKAVIEANKSNEEWAETLAEVGDDMQPVVTGLKKFGTAVLKEAKDPLEDVADYLLDDVLPALGKLSKWVLNNGTTIKNTVITVTTTLVAYKAATMAATISQEGLKGAIMATTAAEKALQLVQAATPWGLAAVAITGVVTALALYVRSTKEAKQPVDALTESERELMESANRTAESFRDQQATTAESMAGISSQMGHVQKLSDELQKLADASGKVQEKDQGRAQFILNELNEALGTEYQMTDGVIGKYKELKESIDTVIQSKTANALLEAGNADYVAALQAESEALQNVVLSEKDYAAQLAISQEADRVAKEARVALQKKVADAKNEADLRSLASEAQRVTNLEAKAEQERGILEEKEKAYTEAAANYGNYSNTISTYEDAQQATLEGNYQKAVDLLKKKGGSYGEYANDVSDATRSAIDSLYKEAIDAGIEADRTKRNFENGVEGYTEEMVKEAEEGYEAALNEWATAKVDAESVGKDLGSGLGKGMDGEKSSLISKAKSIVKNIISAFRKEADSHSPSRKMIDFGEDMGEGAAIGMENKTDRLDDVAQGQVDRLLGTYAEAGDTTGQSVFRAVQGKEWTRRAETHRAALGGTASQLDRILGAIERGQVLLLDGDAIVGGTIDKYDSALGKRRALVARGAM